MTLDANAADECPNHLAYCEHKCTDNTRAAPALLLLFHHIPNNQGSGGALQSFASTHITLILSVESFGAVVKGP